MRQLKDVRLALRRSGLTWKDLTSRADGIVLFGSRAVGCHSPESDIDLLCIGAGRRISCKELHVVWISRRRVASSDWLSGELGGHVAKYGVWLKGPNIIGTPRPASVSAIARKIQKIRERAEVLREKWKQLSTDFRRNEVRKLRRDVQRLVILESGRAVPPTPILDDLWRRIRDKQEFTRLSLSKRAGLARLVIPLIFRQKPKKREFHQRSFN
jgi:hypothetical protein